MFHVLHGSLSRTHTRTHISERTTASRATPHDVFLDAHGNMTIFTRVTKAGLSISQSVETKKRTEAENKFAAFLAAAVMVQFSILVGWWWGWWR